LVKNKNRQRFTDLISVADDGCGFRHGDGLPEQLDQAVSSSGSALRHVSRRTKLLCFLVSSISNIFIAP
jgi:hypothetical protein